MPSREDDRRSGSRPAAPVPEETVPRGRGTVPHATIDETTRPSSGSTSAAAADDRTVVRRPDPPRRPEAQRGSAEARRPAQARASAPRRPPRPVGAVVPEREPAPQPTGTERVLGHLQREWKFTAACVGAAILVGVGAIWLWGNGHPVFAIIAAVLVVPISLAALFVRRAPCPRCAKPLMIIGIEQCEHCREYIRVEGQQLRVVEPGFIADYPTFELNLPLPLIPRIAFPDDVCAVCGRSPAATDRLDVQGTIVEIPHCGEHPGGVVWSVGLVTEAVPTVTFRFRSFDFWRTVRQLNWAHVRSGMWR